jgi:hypothetical protein
MTEVIKKKYCSRISACCKQVGTDYSSFFDFIKKVSKDRFGITKLIDLVNTKSDSLPEKN